MIALATLLLATPVFGFSLQAPTDGLQPQLVLAAGSTGSTRISPMLAAALAADEATAGSDKAPVPDSERIYREETKERNKLAKQHRLLGLSTWGAMTVTVALGAIQYYNLYGFGAGVGSNPCVKGDAIFGQGQCYGTPWPHAIAAGVTTALYTTTFTISLLMPDPDDLANGKGEFADTLRLHKLLRWVHFGGMVAQILLGTVIGTDVAGLDRANDYGTLQALATVHLAAGLITYGAMTWAGALMTF